MVLTAGISPNPGNGSMLVALAEEGFQNLRGGDYSFESLALASKVLARHDLSHVRIGVRFALACGQRMRYVTSHGLTLRAWVASRP